MPLIGAGALDVYQSAAAIWTDGVYFSEVIGCQDAAALCPGYNSNEALEGSEVWAFNRADLESGAPLRVQTTQGVGGIGAGNFAGSRTTTTFSNLDADGLVPANLETMTGATTRRAFGHREPATNALHVHVRPSRHRRHAAR